MTNKNVKCSRLRRKWLISLTVVAVVLGVMSGLLGWHYRVHLTWKYYEWQGIFPAIKAIPYSEMPEVDIPENWVVCSLGCLRFSLPPELAALEDTTRKTESFVAFYDDFHAIAVMSDPTNGEVAPLLELASEFIVNHDGTLTTPRVYLEFCKFSTDDFRWSMSSRDVVRFMLFATVYHWSNMGWKTAETFFYDDVDRIVSFNNDRLVEITWQTTTAPPHGGVISVTFKGGNPTNAERDLLEMLARKICQSIRVVCTCSQNSWQPLQGIASTNVTASMKYATPPTPSLPFGVYFFLYRHYFGFHLFGKRTCRFPDPRSLPPHHTSGIIMSCKQRTMNRAFH